jgi:hypothetical protein
MSRLALRFAFVLMLVGFAVAAPGASASISAEAPLDTATPSAARAACCTVTYNAAKTHFQVTGTVSYKGTPVLFSFHGPCASPAGPGRAHVKSRWIPVREIVAGYHTIDIVQKVSGKIVYSKSPRFFVKGTAQLRKPTATITSGPSGVVTGTSALFKFKVANAAKVLCRLDARPWRSCSLWEQYENLAPGPHVFELRAYALGGPTYAKATRNFTLSAPPPG